MINNKYQVRISQGHLSSTLTVGTPLPYMVELKIIYFLNFSHISKEDLWSSILSQSSKPVVDNEYSENKIKNQEPAENNAKECFPILTSEGAQCYRHKIVSNNEIDPPNSIVIAITLSSTACKVKTFIDVFLRYTVLCFWNFSKFKEFTKLIGTNIFTLNNKTNYQNKNTK